MPNCRTLIVEDDPPARKALEALLRQKGHDVLTAAGVGEALEALRWPPQCVILDLILPDGNGVTVLRRIRRTLPDVRVAIVTGMSDPFGLSDITDLEPDALFEKPLDTAALLKWLHRRKRAKRPASH